jgi:translation initiation factor 2 subunit 1
MNTLLHAAAAGCGPTARAHERRVWPRRGRLSRKSERRFYTPLPYIVLFIMASSDYPEPGELVIGTVKNIFNQGAFIDLDEYPGKRGMLHLTEISLKWVRNIRDYVKEEQKVVLLVLRTDPSRGHIDLSLRRVNDAQRKQKLQQVKQRQRAAKLIELVAADVKMDVGKAQEAVAKALSGYESVYAGLEAIAADHSVADKLALEEKVRKKLLELVVKSIKPPAVEIIGFVELRSFESDGVTAVKGALAEIRKHKATDAELTLTYGSAPLYRVKVTAADYKSAEKTLKSAVEQGIAFIESKHGSGEFHRELEAK